MPQRCTVILCGLLAFLTLVLDTLSAPTVVLFTTLFLSAVLISLTRHTTASLLAILAFYIPYYAFAAFPYWEYQVLTSVNDGFSFGRSIHVCHSTVVPATTILICLSWLLHSRRLGLFVGVVFCVIAMIVPHVLSSYFLTHDTNAADIAEVTLLTRYTLAFANFAAFLILLACELTTGTLWSLKSRSLGVVIALTIMCLIGFQLWIDYDPENRTSDRDIVLWWPLRGEDTQDYATADSGIGLDNIGLFGELPKLLMHQGFRVRKSDLLGTDVLANAGLLCMFTPPRPLEPEEVACIHNFVSNGGSLLVAGEHTNLGGARDIYAELLETYGIAFNFDTVTSVLDDSIAGTRTYNLPLGRLFRSHPRLQYNRGASLAILDARAEPILSGDLWYTDAGDNANEDGAFLGDERLTRGDRLGNAVLVASAGRGSGSVVVFGDTSPFINRNLAFNAAFLLKLFASLNGGWPSQSDPFVEGGASRHSVISTDEANVFNRDGFSPTSVTALSVAIMRLGQTVSVGTWTGVHAGDAVFIINPAQHLNCERVLSAVRDGVTIVVSGAGDNSFFREFAHNCGVSVGDYPLGVLQGATLNPYSSWGVTCDTLSGEPISAGDYAIGVVHRLDKGKLVLLADGGYFSSKNLETSNSRDEKNAEFIRYILSN